VNASSPVTSPLMGEDAAPMERAVGVRVGHPLRVPGQAGEPVSTFLNLYARAGLSCLEDTRSARNRHREDVEDIRGDLMALRVNKSC
jgi:hypothetical protein